MTRLLMFLAAIMMAISCTPDPSHMDIDTDGPDSTCPNGSVTRVYFKDKNKNFTLDSGEEVLDRKKKCIPSAPLAIDTSLLPPGSSSCLNGGIRLTYFQDNDKDGKIDSGEGVLNKVDKCFSPPSLPLFSQENIPAGPTCKYGGVKIHIGIDANKNGKLEVNERTSSQNQCKVNQGNGINASVEAPGANCKYGGVKIIVWTDLNNNSQMDKGEPQQKPTYFCNVKIDGRNSAVRWEDIPKGTKTCPAGGRYLIFGLDKNNNGTLDKDEEETKFPVCNGQTPFMKSTKILPSQTGACLFGGTNFKAGIDLNGNGKLDDAEAQINVDVCHVPVNKQKWLVRNSLIKPQDQDPKSPCKWGGIKMEVGFDKNGNNILEATELDPKNGGSTVNVCNKVQVVNGKSTLFKKVPASSAQCPFGGHILQYGLDDNTNGALETSEVDNFVLVCSGRDGYNMAYSPKKAVAKGQKGCKEGGVEYTMALDTNRNGKLDSNETLNRQTVVICHGLRGRPTLMKQGAASTKVCPNGGVQFQSGLDKNDNGVLDSNEVQHTHFACNGRNGAPAMTRHSAASTTICRYGGTKIQSGTDDDPRNGKLDDKEVNHTSYVCNGANGKDALTHHSKASTTVCKYGGTRFESGTDLDGDGILDPSEVTGTSFVCNGANGAEAIVEIDPAPTTQCPNGGIKVTSGVDVDGSGDLDSSEIDFTGYVCNGQNAKASP